MRARRTEKARRAGGALRAPLGPPLAPFRHSAPQLSLRDA